MKTLIEVAKKWGPLLPTWYSHEVHDIVVGIISDKENGGKLHACKFLRETANKRKDEWVDADGLPKEFYLKDCKEICDFIETEVKPRITMTVEELETIIRTTYYDGFEQGKLWKTIRAIELPQLSIDYAKSVIKKLR